MLAALRGGAGRRVLRDARRATRPGARGSRADRRRPERWRCFEDLGVQMNRAFDAGELRREAARGCSPATSASRARSTSRSPLVAIATGGRLATGATSPVVGAPIISGLVPCNVIADEILTDHPNRYRAHDRRGGQPGALARRLAAHARGARARSTLVVVIDVAMTRDRAARRLRAARRRRQFEKAEATFFNFDFPRNVFHLRRPVLPPPPGALPEAGDPRPAGRGARRHHRGRLAPLREAAAAGPRPSPRPFLAG